jgi:protein-disulfide isomerase
MTSSSPLHILPFLLLVPAACSRDDSAVKDRLESIDQRLASIETAMKSGGGRGAAGAGAERGAQRPRPTPTDVYAIDIGASPVEGQNDAKVTIVEGFEFACPYCRKVGPTLEQLKKDYGDDLRIVKKQYVVHPQTATLPALAACAANRQGKYTQMEEGLWVKGFEADRNFSQ